MEEITVIQDGYQTVRAVPNDVPVVGYGNNVVNTLRIRDAEADQEFCLDSFDKVYMKRLLSSRTLLRRSLKFFIQMIITMQVRN